MGCVVSLFWTERRILAAAACATNHASSAKRAGGGDMIYLRHSSVNWARQGLDEGSVVFRSISFSPIFD